MCFKKLQLEQKEWQDKNFPNHKNHHCLLGLVEEVGELSHSHLKNDQNIRKNEDHRKKTEDAIGDIIIYLAGYCNANGYDLEKCVKETWGEVKQRDWIKNKNNGII